MQTIGILAKWAANFFDESNPQSFSRLISFVIVAFVLGWDTSYVYHTHALPDVATMAGEAAFMTSFYVVRRAAGAVTDSRKDTEPPKP